MIASASARIWGAGVGGVSVSVLEGTFPVGGIMCGRMYEGDASVWSGIN